MCTCRYKCKGRRLKYRCEYRCGHLTRRGKGSWGADYEPEKRLILRRILKYRCKYKYKYHLAHVGAHAGDTLGVVICVGEQSELGGHGALHQLEASARDGGGGVVGRQLEHLVYSCGR